MHDNIAVLLGHSLYRALSSLTGTFHITPLQLGEGIGCIFALMILVQLYGAIRGRTSFTLEDE